MSKPVFKDPFSFTGRRNRKSYFLFGLTLFGIALIIGFVAVLLAPGYSSMMNGTTYGGGYMGMMSALNPATIIVLAVVTIPLAISGWAVASQRCRDIGWTGWAVLLTIIPYVGGIFGLVILFIPGTQGENRYGPDPLL